MNNQDKNFQSDLQNVKQNEIIDQPPTNDLTVDDILNEFSVDVNTYKISAKEDLPTNGVEYPENMYIYIFPLTGYDEKQLLNISTMGGNTKNNIYQTFKLYQRKFKFVIQDPETKEEQVIPFKIENLMLPDYLSLLFLLQSITYPENMLIESTVECTTCQMLHQQGKMTEDEIDKHVPYTINLVEDVEVSTLYEVYGQEYPLKANLQTPTSVIPITYGFIPIKYLVDMFALMSPSDNDQDLSTQAKYIKYMIETFYKYGIKTIKGKEFTPQEKLQIFYSDKITANVLKYLQEEIILPFLSEIGLQPITKTLKCKHGHEFTLVIKDYITAFFFRNTP